jgi:hypothetical protein
MAKHKLCGQVSRFCGQVTSFEAKFKFCGQGEGQVSIPSAVKSGGQVSLKSVVKSQVSLKSVVKSLLCGQVSSLKWSSGLFFVVKSHVSRKSVVKSQVSLKSVVKSLLCGQVSSLWSSLTQALWSSLTVVTVVKSLVVWWSSHCGQVSLRGHCGHCGQVSLWS